jgi:tetratricopeptide (TPR) repeat protein/capsular polysaccharide biosynthesis protein
MSIQEYIRLAEGYLAQGKWAEAIANCRQWIKLQPDSAAAYTMLGEAIEAEGDVNEAWRNYLKALEISPLFVRAHVCLGLLYSEYNWLDEAVVHYQQILAIKPNWAELHYNLANVFHKQGNLAAAINSYSKAIALKANYADACYNLGVVLDENNQLEAAIDAYEQVIAIAPNYLKAYSNLGCVLVKQEKAQEAIAIYELAIAIQPDWATLYNNLGQVLLDKSPDQAIAAYHKAIELEPDLVLAHYNLGKAWQIQGEYSAAVVCFDRVVELNPDYISGYTDAGFSLMALGKIGKALPYFAQAIALKPDFVEAYCALGESEQFAQDDDDEFSKAIAACGRFLQALTGRKFGNGLCNGFNGFKRITNFQFPITDSQFPIPDSQLEIGEICDNLAEIYWHLGNALTEYGGHEAATAYYQKAVQIQPKNTEIYWRLGNSLVKQKRLDAAILVYHMALAIQPAQPQVYFELAKVLERQGDLERVLDYYQKVLELQSHGYSQPQLSKQDNGIEFALNAIELPQGIYLSTWDWLVAAKLDAGNYVEIVWKYAPEASTENIPNASATLRLRSESGTSSQLANSDCGGLTCGLCLQRLSKWFDPIHLGWGVCRLSNSQPLPVESPKTFVAAIPDGRVWIVPKENYWLICKAIAVMTPDNYLLADLSRDYPGFLPGCERHDVRKHSVFNLESFPPLKQIEGSVAVLSGLSGNVYFHWMVDVLPRIELLRRSGRDLAEIDWFLVNSYQHQFQRESLRILGIPEEKVLESDRLPHIQATELIVPSFAGYLGWPSGWAIDFLRREFLKGIIPSYHYPKRIYISRSKARYRRVLNEADVVEVLEGFGFVSILPESMSLQEQIAYFYHAEVIVAAHGSGLTNTIFCRAGTKVIELMSPHYISHYYWGSSQYLQLEHYFLTGEAFECYPIRQLMYQNSLTEDILVNLSSLKRMVEVVGLG